MPNLAVCKLYTTGVEINPNHTYYHSEVGTVYSVNAIIKQGESTSSNNKAMAVGIQIHNLLHHYLTGNTRAVSNLAKDLPEEAKNKARALCTEAKKLLSQSSYQPQVEQRFIFKENEVVYGGTPDLILANTVIDWKTGAYYPHYIEQLSAYAYAMGKKEARVYYFENNQLTHKHFNEKELTQAYKEFVIKANNLNGIMTKQMKSFALGFEKLHKLEQIAREANQALANAKEKYASYIQEKGYTRLSIGGYGYSQVAPTVSLSLKAEAKQQLLKEHPEYFTTTKREGFVRFTFPKTPQLTNEV